MKLPLLIAVMFGLCFAVLGCTNDDGGNNPTTDYNYNNIMDTLKGEWLWVATYTPKNGLIKNEYKVLIKILKQAKDEKISYEAYVQDTLFKADNFKINAENKSWKDWKENNIILPHFISDYWYLKFAGTDGQANIDTLVFFEGANDGYFYYYSKIK